jgi:hypothetical protein
MIIFISYRRNDSRHISDRIYDRLVASFRQETVFKDVDSIPLGADFRRVLEEYVGKCDLFIAIIGTRWLDILDDIGRRRLDDQNDFVRIEIETALQRNIPIVPILVDQARMPKVAELPTGLRELAYRNATHVRPDPDFHRDMERVIRACEEMRPNSQTSSRAKPGDEERIALEHLYRFFDRPAFRHPFHYECDLKAFDRAMEETVQGLNTGILGTRRGDLIAKTLSRHDFHTPSWRKALGDVEQLIGEIRQRFAVAVRVGILRSSSSGLTFSTYEGDGLMLIRSMNSLRNDVIRIVNSLFAETGKEALPLISESHGGWMEAKKIFRMRDEGEFD